MKILITGGAGFIGSHLADALVAKDHAICIVDNFETGKQANINPRCHNKPVPTIDISNISILTSIFDMFRPDVVIHAAASYKNPSDWHTDALTNVVGTANVAMLSKTYKVQRVIYFQTSLCYGLKPEQSPITISCPCNPQGTSYAITKTAGEQLLLMSGLDVVSFRLANHFGDRNLSGPVPTFYQRLSQGKSCFVMDTRRDFVYVSDLVRLVCRAVAGEGRKGAYHISSGSDFHIRELYDAVREAMALPPDPDVKVVPRGADDAPTLLLDPSATHAEFPGWRTEVSLKDGIKKAVEFYQSTQVTETYTHLKMDTAKE